MGQKQSLCGKSTKVQDCTEAVRVEAAADEPPRSLASSLSYDSSSSTGSVTDSSSTSHSSIYSSSESCDWDESYLDPYQRDLKKVEQAVTIVTTVNESEA